MKANEIVKEWNSVRNTKYQTSLNGEDSSLVKAINKLVEVSSEEEVTKYFMEKMKDNSVEIWSLTRSYEFTSWRKENQAKEQSEAVKQQVENQTQGLGLLNVLSQEIINVMGKDLANKINEQVKANIDEYVQDKVLTKVISINDKVKKVDGIVHNKFEEVLNWVNLDEPVMLIGPAGSGKNELLEQVAKALDLDFYCMNAVKDEYKLTGYGDANGEYVKTSFYDAFTKGGLFFLDEVDASIPDVLVILNCAIANRYFDFPVLGRAVAHPNFRVVAAANTFGLGASMEYVGRNQLDGATLNRFAKVRIDYDTNIEKAICPDKDILDFVRAFRKACNENGYKHIISYRDMSRLYKAIAVAKMDIKKAIEGSITCSVEKDSLSGILSRMSSSLKYKEYLNEIYQSREY